MAEHIVYLQEKAQNENAEDIDAYKTMAADTEREQEACEWCNAFFGPALSKPTSPV